MKNYDLISHWYHYIEGMDQSPKEYYQSLADLISENNLPKVKMKLFNLPSSGVFSSGRVYLNIRYARIVFLVCCAPYGKGSFVSYWHYKDVSDFRNIIRGIPIIGNALDRLFWSETLFEIDLKYMFQSVLHKLILEVIDKEVKDKGLRALTEFERRYQMFHSNNAG